MGAEALGQTRPDRLAPDTGFQDISVPLARRHAPPSFAVMIGGLIFAVTGIGLSLSGGWFHATRRRATDVMVVINAQGLIRSFSLAAGAASSLTFGVSSHSTNDSHTKHLRRELRK